jgi:hypothetical protein
MKKISTSPIRNLGKFAHPPKGGPKAVLGKIRTTKRTRSVARQIKFGK